MSTSPVSRPTCEDCGMAHQHPTTDETPLSTGSGILPDWEVDELPDPPKMTWSIVSLVGPGLMMAGAAIGGGEWLTGPRNTAQYGGTLMWLAGLSILFQVVYNLEVIRYAMYSGESIFVGFFRLMPGPKFWTVVYLFIDFFGLWPYLSANAAVPLAAVFLGHPPAVLPFVYDQGFDSKQVAAFAAANNIDESELQSVYKRESFLRNSKVDILELQAKREKAELDLQSADDAQREQLRTDIAKFTQDEKELAAAVAGTIKFGLTTSKTSEKYPASVLSWIEREKQMVKWLGITIFLVSFIPLIFGGKIYKVLEGIMTVKIVLVLGYLLVLGFFYVSRGAWAEAFGGFIFISRDYLGMVNGEPMFGDWQLRLFPKLAEGQKLDWALLSAFAAVAGQGGLNNAQFSSYSRDKGWGMGQKVGAIPSLVGGRDLMLPHTGKCFAPNATSLPIWRRWMNLIRRDQWMIWFGGCVLGMAIPSVVSLDPAYRDTVKLIGGDAAAAATAFALSSQHGQIFWFLTLLCGFIVLAPNQITTTDGLVRRWTEVIWTGSSWLKHLPGGAVRYLYFGLLVAYALWGMTVLLWIGDSGMGIVKIGSVIMNFALGFSALHTLVVNCLLLPKPVRPGLLSRLGLVGCGIFFIWVAAMGAPQAIQDVGLDKWALSWVPYFKAISNS